MSFSKFASFIAMLLIAITMSVAPADAHKKKHPEQASPAVAAAAQPGKGSNAVAQPTVAESKDDHMAGMMREMEEERASMSTGERLLDWLGRLHPSIVHFPLAFFPAALFTAIVGRRRPGFAKPVQFLVIAGGITAPLAMLFGWFDGGLTLADTDPLLRIHRWLGTGIGILGFGLAIWAWKRPESDRSAGMLIGLGVLTAALIVQGWYGGAMVHGMDHLNW